MDAGLPPDGVDVHAHVLDPAHPTVPGAAYAATAAMTLDAYAAHLEAIGLRRGVLVSASVYGTDPTVLLEALAAARDRGLDLRGVAVVDPDRPDAVLDAELDRLAAAGVRAVRCQDLMTGGTPLDALERLAPRVGHVEIWTHLDAHLDDLPRLVRALGRPVVLDHLGHLRDERAAGPMIDLARDGLAWITVSGAYRQRPDLAPADATEALVPLVHRLADAVPDRLLWGSDRPFVGFDDRRTPTPDELVAEVHRFLPDAGLRRRVLVDNPERCYGFAPS